MAAKQADDKIAGGIVLILAVGIVAIVAGASENLGKILMVIMFGFLLGWLMTTSGSGLLGKWIGVYSPPQTSSPGPVRDILI